MINKSDQIFKSVFGTSWNNLPPVFLKRYSNRPFSHDVCSVKGVMDIHYSKFMSLLIPIFKLLRVLVPFQGNNIPVTVDLCSEINSDRVYFNRKFYFPGKPAYPFNSYVKVIKNNIVIEQMAFCIAWKMQYFYDGNKVVMQHLGYVFNIAGLYISLPIQIFIGEGHAEEEMIDENSYRISMNMTHPLFGELYHYSGNFSFVGLST